MTMTENQLYERCRKKMDIADFEDYIRTYPNGAHIEHIKGWYPELLINYLKQDSDSQSKNVNVEICKRCRQYKFILNELRNNDIENSQYWGSLIEKVIGQEKDAKSKYIKELKEKKGALQAVEYAKLFDTDLLNESDLKEVGITYDQLNILKETRSAISINIEPLDETEFADGKYKLPANCTEIYLWGMPASGKSCCLSAVLSRASELGYCRGYDAGITGNDYFEKLTNVFKINDGNGTVLSTLITGTNTNSIASASYTIEHPIYKKRRMCLIDLAGETFKSMRNVNNNKEINDKALKLCLDVTRSYLADKRNRKLHFFIVPYAKPGSEKLYDGISVSQYLQSAAQYLLSNGVITNSTDGIYIIVTKVDLMDCSPLEYDVKAEEYVRTKFSSFYNGMESICKDQGIGTSTKRVEVLPFSIGEMVSRELCKFKAAGAERLIELISKKSHKVGGFWDKILSI